MGGKGKPSPPDWGNPQPSPSLTTGCSGTLHTAGPGDRVFVTDRRAWLGGLHAVQARVGEVVEGEPRIELGPTAWDAVVAKGRDGETDIFGIIHRPKGFDPAKTYPVVEYIYAGPHSSFVPKSFQAFTQMREIAETFAAAIGRHAPEETFADLLGPEAIAGLEAAGLLEPLGGQTTTAWAVRPLRRTSRRAGIRSARNR